MGRAPFHGNAGDGRARRGGTGRSSASSWSYMAASSAIGALGPVPLHVAGKSERRKVRGRRQRGATTPSSADELCEMEFLGMIVCAARAENGRVLRSAGYRAHDLLRSVWRSPSLGNRSGRSAFFFGFAPHLDQEPARILRDEGISGLNALSLLEAVGRGAEEDRVRPSDSKEAIHAESMHQNPRSAIQQTRSDGSFRIVDGVREVTDQPITHLISL